MGDVPFSCTAVGYQIAGIPADFVRINLAIGQSTILTNLGIIVNAIGYSVLDNFIYGINYDTSELIRIDSTPTVRNYGAVSNLPIGGYNAGTIDLQGHLFIYISELENYYVVDINTSSSTFGQLLNPTNNYILDTSPFGTPLSIALNIFDWAYNPTDGQLYAVDNTTGNVVKVNPTTGVVTTLITIGIPVGAYKTTFIDIDGNIYEIDSNSSLVYKITISGDTATGEIFSTSLNTIQNNNVNCPLSRVLIDFGDTPDIRLITSSDNYKSIPETNSSQNQIVNQLSLGIGVTSEVDTFQKPIAKKNIDGVYLLPLPILSTTATTYSFTELVTNNTGVDANLYAWIDFNKDGIFQENESFTTVVHPSSSVQNIPITFNVPFGITQGHTFARIYITTDTLINENTLSTSKDTRSIGSASDGKIEDYYLQIAVTTPTCPLPISQTINTNTTKTGKITSIDPFNLPITYSVGNTPANGTVTINTITGDWIYTPNQNFVGIDTFLLVATNKNGESCTTNATITVVEFNPNYSLPPTCSIPQAQGMLVNTIANGSVIAIDPQGQTLTYSITTFSINGTVVINSVTGTWTYKPDVNFVGTDSFAITATNQSGLSCTVKFIINIHQPSVQIDKVSDNHNILLGNIFTYTINIKNTGTIPIQSSIITDILPTQLEVEQLQLNENIITGNLNLGVNVGALAVGEIKSLTITAKVNSPLPTNSFKNLITGDFQVFIDSNLPSITITQQAQEDIEVNIYNPKLTLIKSANKKITAVGETVTYTIIARNDGNIELNDIVINDLLSPELKFIDGSVKINNISQLTSSIISEVNIELLAIGQSKIITFDVEIISQGNGTINNISTSIFQFKPSLTESPVSGTSTSNLYSLIVKHPSLLVTKTSDKEIALLDDIITYTAIINNNGDTDAINVIFKSTLPSIAQFIDGTFTVNKNLINSVNLNKGINIGNISVGETVIITYQVRVMSPSCQNSLTNSAYVTFGYFTSSGIINYMRSNESSVEVILALSIFKQTNIQNYFEIPCKKPDIKQINVVTANVEIENCYAIETPIGTSIEGQQLTGYKMIIHGNIIFIIDYTADVPEQNVHSAHYCSPFSTFVILPSNFSFSCQSSINAIIEDVYSNQISNRCFFANATALITVGIR